MEQPPALQFGDNLAGKGLLRLCGEARPRLVIPAWISTGCSRASQASRSPRKPGWNLPASGAQPMWRS